MVVSSSGTMDEVAVFVEMQQELYDALSRETGKVLEHEQVKAAMNQLKKKIKDVIGLSMKVQIVAPDTIPRSEGGKLNRILDKRK